MDVNDRIYDETLFPEYERKLHQERRSALRTLAAGVVAFLIAYPLVAFVLNPQASLTERLQGALILLSLPVFFGALGWFVYSFKKRHPLRVGKEMVFSGSLRIPFARILQVTWLGPERGAILQLDPNVYRISRHGITGEELLRPAEFLGALEGRVEVRREGDASEVPTTQP